MFVEKFIEYKDIYNRWHWLQWSNMEDIHSDTLFQETNGAFNYYLFSDWNWGDVYFKERGFPQDSSEELRHFLENSKDLDNNFSYYTLQEVKDLLIKLQDKAWTIIKKELDERDEGLLNEKLFDLANILKTIADALEVKTNNKFDFLKVEKTEEEHNTEWFKNVLVEIWDELSDVSNEITRIETMCEQVLHKVIKPENIRITYNNFDNGKEN